MAKSKACLKHVYGWVNFDHPFAIMKLSLVDRPNIKIYESDYGDDKIRHGMLPFGNWYTSVTIAKREAIKYLKQQQVRVNNSLHAIRNTTCNTCREYQ